MLRIADVKGWGRPWLNTIFKRSTNPWLRSQGFVEIAKQEKEFCRIVNMELRKNVETSVVLDPVLGHRLAATYLTYTAT